VTSGEVHGYGWYAAHNCIAAFADTIRMSGEAAGYRWARPKLTGVPMTDTKEAVIHEALTVIDKALGQMMSRELVSSNEVTDVLLDVRSLLTLPEAVEN